MPAEAQRGSRPIRDKDKRNLFDIAGQTCTVNGSAPPAGLWKRSESGRLPNCPSGSSAQIPSAIFPRRGNSPASRNPANPDRDFLRSRQLIGWFFQRFRTMCSDPETCRHHLEWRAADYWQGWYRYMNIIPENMPGPKAGKGENYYFPGRTGRVRLSCRSTYFRFDLHRYR